LNGVSWLVSDRVGELVTELLGLSSEKLVAESGDSSDMSAVRSRCRATTSEEVTVDTNVCVFVCNSVL
jgi:hypothetical protein